MYEELVKSLRVCGDALEKAAFADYETCLYKQAADAIEELEHELKSLYKMMGTHPDPKGECGEAGVPLPEPPKEET